MITKYGYKIIIFTGVLLVLLASASFIWNNVALWIVTALVGVLFIFHFFFFRDPERSIPMQPNQILSPADGKIIKIDTVDEPLYIKGKALRVCIFMSVFNAHINRNPVDGTVEFLEHKSGEFLAAFAENAGDVNEQMRIGVNTSHGKIFFKQIAGLIARRVVCRLEQGETVKAGERFGMIKYSSRVDLFLPLDTTLHVKLHDTVKAGLSIIGEFKA